MSDLEIARRADVSLQIAELRKLRDQIDREIEELICPCTGPVPARCAPECLSEDGSNE